MKTALSSSHFNNLLAKSDLVDTGIVCKTPFETVSDIKPGEYLRMWSADNTCYHIIKLPCNIRELPVFKGHIYIGTDYAKNYLLDHGFYVPSDGVTQQTKNFISYRNFNYQVLRGDWNRYIKKDMLKEFAENVLELPDINSLPKRISDTAKFIINLEKDHYIVESNNEGKSVDLRSQTLLSWFTVTDDERFEMISKLNNNKGDFFCNLGILAFFVGIVISIYFVTEEIGCHNIGDYIEVILGSPLIIFLSFIQLLLSWLSLFFDDISFTLIYICIPILVGILLCILGIFLDKIITEPMVVNKRKRIARDIVDPKIDSLDALRDKYLNEQGIINDGAKEFDSIMTNLSECDDVSYVHQNTNSSFDFGLIDIANSSLLYFGFPYVFETGEYFRPLFVQEQNGTDFITCFDYYRNSYIDYIDYVDRFAYPIIRAHQLEIEKDGMLALYKYLIEDLRMQMRTDEIKNVVNSLRDQLHRDNLAMMNQMVQMSNKINDIESSIHELKDTIDSIDWSPTVIVHVDSYGNYY